MGLDCISAICVCLNLLLLSILYLFPFPVPSLFNGQKSDETLPHRSIALQYSILGAHAVELSALEQPSAEI